MEHDGDRQCGNHRDRSDHLAVHARSHNEQSRQAVPPSESRPVTKSDTTIPLSYANYFLSKHVFFLRGRSWETHPCLVIFDKLNVKIVTGRRMDLIHWFRKPCPWDSSCFNICIRME